MLLTYRWVNIGVRRWHLQLKCDKELRDLSNMFNPVLRGWANYYGRFYASALNPLWQHVNSYLVRWMQRKYNACAATNSRGAGAEQARVLDHRDVCALEPGCIPGWLDDGSRMSREVHVRFCEGLGLKCAGLLTCLFGSAIGTISCCPLSMHSAAE